METTKKLYDLDAYGTEFEAKVLTCEEVKKKDTTDYAVTLDQTLFFPEEGGQSPDQGTINGISGCPDKKGRDHAYARCSGQGGKHGKRKDRLEASFLQHAAALRRAYFFRSGSQPFRL